MQSFPSVSLVIPAAGVGARLGGVHKIALTIAGRTLLDWVLSSIGHLATEIIVAYPPGQPVPNMPGVRAIVGGNTRQQTVHRLAQAATSAYTVVHDVARPFVAPSVTSALLAQLAHVDAATTALPMADTVMKTGTYTIANREQLLRVQTPQAFRTTALLQAHEHAKEHQYTATDDFQLVRLYGGSTAHVLGSEFTRKITTREDIAIAEALAHSGALKDFV